LVATEQPPKIESLSAMKSDLPDGSLDLSLRSRDAPDGAAIWLQSKLSPQAQKFPGAD
jgi:hypothetical protein